MSDSGEPRPQVRVWDLPIRLFHWLLATLVVLLIITGWRQSLDLHIRLGQAVGILLIFRLIWGVVGGSTARFSDFIRGPGAIFAYLKTGISPTLGHNPLGAFSVLGFLILLGFQVGTGLFSQDEIGISEGPLAKLVSGSQSTQLSGLHAKNAYLILALIALHILAIVVYRIRGQNLIVPMITGRKEKPAASFVETTGGNVWLALVLLVAVAALWRLALRVLTGA